MEFATPEVMPEGKSPQAATHAGMLPLMRKMAAIIRHRFNPEFFEQIMHEALAEMANEIQIDADGFTRAVNAARAASGLPPLVSAEGELETRLTEALMVYREQWAEEQKAALAGQIKAAIEAHEAARAAGVPATPVAEAGGYDGDPPPPRGGARRRAGA